MEKKSTSFTLSPKAKNMLKQLSNHLGISKTGVLEIIIRDRVKTENIDES